MPTPHKTGHDKLDRQLVPFDDKMRNLELWRMNLVPPAVGIFDEPKRCYELNNEWAKIVMGLVSWLAETPVWRDAENEGYSAIESILKFMIGQPCMSFELRQNPENNCQLQQSLDGGETWTTAFDYSLCTNEVTNEANNSTIANNSIATLEEWIANYTTIDEFAPVAVYDSTSDDDYRDQAVCYALGVIYDAWVELHMQWVRDGGGFKTVFQIVVGAAAALFALLTGGIGAIIGGAILAALAEVGFAFNADATREDLDEVRDDIICCAFQTLVGATPTFAAFQTAFSECTGDELHDYVATELNRACQEQDVYITFLKAVEDAYGLAKYDSLPACPCEIVEQVDWAYKWDFATSNGGWYSTNFSTCPAPASANFAHYATSVGWQSVSTPTNLRHVCYIALQLATPVSINRAILTLVPGNAQQMSIGLRLDDCSVGYSSGFSSPFGTEYDVSFADMEIKQLGITVQRDTSATKLSATVNSFTIYGFGVIPTDLSGGSFI